MRGNNSQESETWTDTPPIPEARRRGRDLFGIAGLPFESRPDRLRAEIRNLGLEDDTIFIYMSDNGPCPWYGGKDVDRLAAHFDRFLAEYENRFEREYGLCSPQARSE